jgi:hypothetical protein
MDLVLRLFLRFSHNLLISNCCSNGVKETVQETLAREASVDSSTQYDEIEIEENSA